MIYNTKEEALKSREKSIIVDNDDLFNKHYKKFSFFNNSPKIMGEFFLYESFICSHSHDNKILYPRLGVYLNSLPCDQTIEVEWVNYRKTWEWRTEYKYSYNDKEYLNYMAELPTEIERMALWSNSMLVYGVWNSMPNWKQLRQAYENTWWYYRTDDEKRDIQLNRILR